jgi:hypothetical protein
MKTEQEIKAAVEEFMRLHSLEIPPSGYVRDHIEQMCISILNTKYDVGHPGGSFVQSVVNNDLMGAFGRADSINRNFIGLYASLLYNY